MLAASSPSLVAGWNRIEDVPIDKHPRADTPGRVHVPLEPREIEVGQLHVQVGAQGPAVDLAGLRGYLDDADYTHVILGTIPETIVPPVLPTWSSPTFSIESMPSNASALAL